VTELLQLKNRRQATYLIPMQAWHETRLFTLAYRFRGACVLLLGCAGMLALWRMRPPVREHWSFVALLIGLGIRLWARGHIGLHSRGGRLEAPYRSVGGPYRYFSHPLYLANSLVALGLVGAGSPCGAAILATAPVFFFYTILGLGENAFLGCVKTLEKRRFIAIKGWSKEIWSVFPPLLGWLLLALGFPAWGLR